MSSIYLKPQFKMEINIYNTSFKWTRVDNKKNQVFEEILLSVLHDQTSV